MLNRRLIRAIVVTFVLGFWIFFSNRQGTIFGQTNGVLPWVITTTPARGDELPVDKGISFTFNTAMNRATVEAAFSVSPAAPGTFTWQDDTTVTYLPSKPLDRETAYIFQFESNARSSEGVGLRDTYLLKLYTTGYLAVTQFFPEETGYMSLKPTFTIVFNRPVVPLGTAEQMKAALRPFMSNYPIEGEGEWLTTSIYTLKVTTDLKDNTEYNFTIPKTLTDVSGGTPKDDKVFKFKTIKVTPVEDVPETFWVHQVVPDNTATKIWRSAPIRIYFNALPDPATVEASFSLVAPDGRVIPGNFSYKDDQNQLIFKPSEWLDYSTTYTIKVDRTKAKSKKGLPLVTDIKMSFTTLDKPTIVGTTPGDGSLVPPATSVWVNFSNPMKLDDFASHIEILPKTPFVVLDSDIGPDSKSARVQFVTLPSTVYTITVNLKGLVDIWGTPLTVTEQPLLYHKPSEDKIQFRYVTGTLSPAVSLETGGQSMGLYNGYHQTRVFVTHRNINAVGLTLNNISLPLFLNAQSNSMRNPDEKQTLVRRWVAPVYNPPNIMRYDLLSITLDGTSIGQQGNIVCVEAAPSVLAVGQTVRVVRKEIPQNDTTPTAPAPVNIRNRPGTQNTDVLGQANNGTEFSVLDGPICADRYVWWKVQSADGTLNGWIPEGDLKQPYVVPLTDPNAATPAATVAATNAPTSTPTAVSASQPDIVANGNLKPGIYRLEMDAPDITDGSQHINHVMLIATENITLKVSQHEALAWVTDLKTAKPAAGLSVQFYRLMRFQYDQQKVLPYGQPIQTDSQGFARLTSSSEIAPDAETIFAAVVSDGHFGITASNWTSGIDAADFQQPTMYNSQDMALYLYTDRRLYKPGEIVYFKGTLRNRNDAVYSLSDKKLIPVDVVDPQNKVIYSKKVAVNEFGSFSDSFTVDGGAQLGEYQVIARPNKPDPKPVGIIGVIINALSTPVPTPPPIRPAHEEKADDPQFVTQITVGNYTPPEFRVNLTPEAPHVTAGDKIRIKVDSSYYFGGPVSLGAVQWEVRIDPYYFYYTGSGSYSFEDYNQDQIGQDYEDDRPQMTASGSGKTDSDGFFTIEMPAALGKSHRSLVYTVEANVFDQSNQLVSGRTQVVVDQGQFQVGVGVDNYVGTVNEKQGMHLIAVKHDSTPLPDTPLDIKVVQRVWTSVQTIEPGTGRTIWENEVGEKEVKTGKVTTDASGKAVFDFTPTAGGAYKIYASTRDSKDNLIKSSTFIWIAGPGYVSWREPNSNRMDLQADKTAYKVGETASILIPTPFQGESTALITIERGGILYKEVLTLTGNSTIYKLPITADMSPNAFFAVTVIKGEDSTNFTAAFRSGLIQLHVDTERLGLNITTKADRSKTAPREQVTYKLKVTDYAGNPVQAEVGLALVDEAVLALMPDDLPSLMDYFYSRQGLGVRTSNALIYNIDQKTREIINVQKGGGKGGNDYFGIFAIRQNFITTPLWQPSVITDKNGEATVTVTLPDQLTTWVLDARAYTLPMGDTHTTLVGQTTDSIVSTRPLLIRPEVPRFYVAGDTSVLSAIVNNNTDDPQEVAVTLEATGIDTKADLVKYATIPANDRMKFDWPMTVQDAKAADFTFKVASKDGRYTDAAKPVTGQGDDRLIPILRYETPDTVTTGGIISSDGGIRTEGLLGPKPGASKDDTLQIHVDRSLAATTTAALKTLKIYPYYCIEQTVSRFLPDAVTFRAQHTLGIKDQVLYEELSDTLQTALQRIYADQKYDGGWGWFISDPSDQLVTAYTLLGMTEAKAAGWNVDNKAFDKAVEILRRSLMDVDEKTDQWDLNRQSFILYVLARSSQVDANTKPPYYDISRSVKLFDQRDRMNLDALAFLTMNFKIVESGNGYHTTPLLDMIKKAAKITLSGRYWQESFNDMWNWTTDTRTTAIILKALVEADPSSPLIPDTVRWLVTARKYDAWESTQETAWSVMALSTWMERTGDLTPNYNFDLALNDKALTTGEKATPDNVRNPFNLSVPITDMKTDQVNRVSVQRNAGSGTMYYSAQLRTYLPVENVKALSRGLTIERKYSLATDKKNTSITSAKVGDRIRVTLTIIVPEALNYVAIEDPLPAGTQSINTSFQTSQRINVIDPFQYGWLYWVFTHKELRDDRTVLYAPYMPMGTYVFSYEIRAGVPGTYRVLPANGHAFYSPQIFGRTNGQLFTLTEAE